MKKLKGFKVVLDKVFKDMFTDPSGDYDLVAILGVLILLFAVTMECREFNFTHVFHYKECLEGTVLYLVGIKGGYALQQGIKVYKDKNNQETNNV